MDSESAICAECVIKLTGESVKTESIEKLEKSYFAKSKNHQALAEAVKRNPDMFVKSVSKMTEATRKLKDTIEEVFGAIFQVLCAKKEHMIQSLELPGRLSNKR